MYAIRPGFPGDVAAPSGASTEAPTSTSPSAASVEDLVRTSRGDPVARAASPPGALTAQVPPAVRRRSHRFRPGGSCSRVAPSADVRDTTAVGRPGERLTRRATERAGAAGDPAQPGAVGTDDRDVTEPVPPAGPPATASSLLSGDHAISYPPAITRRSDVPSGRTTKTPLPVREGDERPVGRPLHVPRRARRCAHRTPRSRPGVARTTAGILR